MLVRGVLARGQTHPAASTASASTLQPLPSAVRGHLLTPPPRPGSGLALLDHRGPHLHIRSPMCLPCPSLGLSDATTAL